MVNPKKDKPPHRGTRPKHSLQNTHKVYCDRCECSYNVPNNRNGDQWLNSHWRHFNCLQKKILRQQEEDASVVRRKRQPSQLRTDKAFVIDGIRQIPVDGIEEEDRDSDESSVDSATNFDMQTPVSQDRFDEETYDDYNESHFGFSAPTFTAEDVGQSYHPSRKEPGIFGTIHLETLTKSGINAIPMVDVATPTSVLSDLQTNIVTTLGVANVRKDFVIRSRYRKDGSVEKKQLADVVDLYDWGMR
jgi:hypothetical protein